MENYKSSVGFSEPSQLCSLFHINLNVL